MKSIGANLKFPSKRPSNWRAVLIQQIVDEINLERKGTPYPEVDAKYINYRLAHLKSRTDLCYLISVAKDSQVRGGSFGKVVWGSIKVKNEN